MIQGEGDRWRRDSAYLRAGRSWGADRNVSSVMVTICVLMVQFISCTNVLFANYQHQYTVLATQSCALQECTSTYLR